MGRLDITGLIMGYPTGDELSVSGGASQSFQGGTVFWCARTNTTYAVKGGVRDKYEALKWEQGLLGFPTSDERQLRGGVSQSFENGQIHWSPCHTWRNPGTLGIRRLGERLAGLSFQRGNR